MEEVVYVCLLSSFERSYFLLSSFKISYCYSDTFWYFYFLADNVWGCNTTPWSPAGTSAHGGKLLIINILSALSNKPFWDSLADWHKLLLAPRCTWVSRPAWHRSSVRGPLSSGDHGALTWAPAPSPSCTPPPAPARTPRLGSRSEHCASRLCISKQHK